MTKTKWILLACFALAFAAGVSLGLFIHNRPPARDDRPSELARELNLTHDQQEQMHKIWSEAMRSTSRPTGDRRTLAQERDQKIQALLSDDQKAKYEAARQDYSRKMDERSQDLARERDQRILAMLSDDQKLKYETAQQDYARKSDELSQERKKAFDEAVRQTKLILTPEQVAKYDEWLKKERDRGPGDGRGPRRRYPATSTSRAASSQQSTSRGAE